jgi:L-ascorbate metabolism protein UlaG (beta-lactamase superfamily)
MIIPLGDSGQKPNNHPVKVTYYGHSCFSVQVAGKELLFDPFITPNPLASSVDLSALRPDYILVSHGHFDHVADLETIARASGATIVGSYEVVQWFAAKGFEKIQHMNSGGSWNFDFGKVTFTIAIHSSSMPDGSYGGQPGGFLVESTEGSFYYSGDTALTRDIALIAEAGPLKFAALCIGDCFTMGVKDALTASGWLGCNEVLGLHYDTFPSIVIDHAAAKDAFLSQGKNLHLLGIGEKKEFG